MISDRNSSLRSGDFVRVGDERTSPTSYARTFECAGLMIYFSVSLKGLHSYCRQVVDCGCSTLNAFLLLLFLGGSSFLNSVIVVLPSTLVEQTYAPLEVELQRWRSGLIGAFED